MFTLNQRMEQMANTVRIHALEAGSRIWVPCDKSVWRAGVVVTTKEDVVNGVRKRVAICEAQGTRGREKVVVDIEGSGPRGGPAYFLRAGDVLTLEAAKEVEDLSLLPMLAEPEILNSVKMRYSSLTIYTFAGPMLLAVNPYQQIPGLYDNATLHKFANVPYGCPSPTPHIFGTAREAFMGIQHSDQSQTVLVSGESGAGKTESAKFVIRFLALAGGRKEQESEVTMERRVLESVPLLEALGNARTLKNDNSSRFGKFIELNFQNMPGVFGPCIMNAETHTYLLETVRVTELSEGERVFHIFYQIMAAATSARQQGALAPGLKVPLLIPSIPSLVFPDINQWSCRKFNYLARSKYEKLPDVDEAALFHRNIEAMRAFHMTDEEISQIISAIVAVLHLGNIHFQEMPGNSEASEIADADLLDGPLCKAAELLGVDSESLEVALCSRLLQLYEKSTKQVIRKSRTRAQAAECRDALARHLYAMVFAYVLGRINMCLSAGPKPHGYQKRSPLPSIGVLDIFGFEVFEHNCFEQLCINYANEVLQQHFNMVVFEHELALYEDEGIPCNVQEIQAAVKLQTSIRESGVVPGVFPMLDDECTISGGTSDNWLRKVALTYGNSTAFELMPLKKGYFKLQHFAGPVEYCADAFLPKNKDTLSSEAMECMQESSKMVLQQQFGSHGRIFGTTQCSTTGRVLKAKANSVSSDFREQLERLMKNIQATRPHFVRCVKPNQMMAPNYFDCFSVLQQLKYQGVLEAIRVARAGFATRFMHSQAVEMYWFLTPTLRKQLDQLMRRGMHYEAAQLLFTHLKESISEILPGWIEVGRSLTFFKSEATDVLGIRVRRYREAAALQIQAWWRSGFLARRFRAICKALRFIQRVERGRVARTGYKYVRTAAIRIQAFRRCYEHRLIFKQLVKAIVCIQRWIRPRLVATKNRTRMLYGKQAERPVQSMSRQTSASSSAGSQRGVKDQALAKPSRFVAPDKFARYLRTSADVPKKKGVRQATVAVPEQQLQLARANELDRVKEELGSQIRQQQEAIQALYTMMSDSNREAKEAAVLAAQEQTSVQNAVVKDYVSAQLQAMNERVADLGSTLVAMDAATKAAKEHAAAQQAALRQQHLAFQASLQEQFQAMKSEMSNIVRGAETDSAKVKGSLTELESFVNSKFTTLEQSFESKQSSIGQEQLEKAMEGLRNDLDAKHRAIDESVAVINPRLGSLANKYEELAGLENHVRDLMERHQVMSEQQQNLLSAPEALKTQLGAELEEQQAAKLMSVREEMATTMEQTLAILRQDLQKTHGYAETMGDQAQAQQQQAASLIAAQREDMAQSMEAALSTLRQYMDNAHGVAETVGKRHQEQEEKNAKHIGLLRGEMAKAMGAALADINRDLQKMKIPRAIAGPSMPIAAARPVSVPRGVKAGPARVALAMGPAPMPGYMPPGFTAPGFTAGPRRNSIGQPSTPLMHPRQIPTATPVRTDTPQQVLSSSMRRQVSPAPPERRRLAQSPPPQERRIPPNVSQALRQSPGPESRLPRASTASSSSAATQMPNRPSTPACSALLPQPQRQTLPGSMNPRQSLGQQNPSTGAFDWTSSNLSGSRDGSGSLRVPGIGTPLLGTPVVSGRGNATENANLLPGTPLLQHRQIEKVWL